MYRGESEPKIVVGRNEFGEWQCNVICPTCAFSSILSSYVNKNSGKVTFNVNNFKRHLAIHGKLYESDADSRSQDSVSEADSLLYPPSSSSSLSYKEPDQCQSCEKSKTLDFEKLIAEKSMTWRDAIFFLFLL